LPAGHEEVFEHVLLARRVTATTVVTRLGDYDPRVVSLSSSGGGRA
jgi:hypothetical protein